MVTGIFLLFCTMAVLAPLRLAATDQGFTPSPASHGADGPLPNAEEPTPPDGSRIYSLHIVTAWNHNDVMHPPQDRDYVSAPGTPTVRIIISPDGSHAWIRMRTPEGRGKPVIASLASDQEGIRTYELHCFAGSVLLVRATPAGLMAELTVNGSGVPVISSVRGQLLPETAG